MKKLMCVAALAVTLAVSGRLCADPAGWESFSPEGEKFSMSFPGAPGSFTKTSKSPFGDMHMTFYSDSDDSVVYGLGVLEMPEEMQAMVNKNPEPALAGLANGIVSGMKAVKGKVISQKKMNVAGHQGLDLTVSLAGGKGLIHCRAVLAEDRIYLLTVMAPADVDVSGETKAFFGSFQLKEALSDN